MILLEWIVVLLVLQAVFAQEYGELGVRVDTVAENLEVPWSVAWLPDGTMLFTERTGQLRVMQDGVLQEEPLLDIDVGSVEGGLLGLAVDPDYAENNYIYLYYTYNELFSSANKLVRYVYSDGMISEDGTVLDKIPGGPFHDGGRIKFGPDGMLYVTTGDAGVPELSQDADSLGGKILRVNPDGTIPHDNPFEGSAVYSMGHRNPQGLDWDATGNLLVTEHGPSGWMGSAHDEINLIVPGGNYGWPRVIGGDAQKGMISPVLHTGHETWAPSGAAFYDSDAIPQWTGKYFVATLRGSHLHVVDFGPGGKEVLGHEKILEREFGRLRDVAVGPDGGLYILTSNQDGRGVPQDNDDRILKISALGVANFEECAAAGNKITGPHPRECRTLDGAVFVEPAAEWLCGSVSESEPVFVTTDMDSYSAGDVLLAQGCVFEGASFERISVVIQGPDGDTITEGTVLPDSEGVFAREFLLDDGAFLVNGTYSVLAEADGRYYSAKTVTVPEFGAVVLVVLVSGLLAVLMLQKSLPGIRYNT